MLKSRRLFLLLAFVALGFAAWRIRQHRLLANPKLPDLGIPGIAAPPPSSAAKSDSPTSSNGGPRRIVTRVHRGAPPAQGAPKAPTEAAEPIAPTAPAEPDAPEVTAETVDQDPAHDFPISSNELVNINTAELQALIHLPGIGPALARRIIEHRDRHGPFGEIAELMAVQGIGENNINQIRKKATV